MPVRRYNAPFSCGPRDTASGFRREVTNFRSRTGGAKKKKRWKKVMIDDPGPPLCGPKLLLLFLSLAICNTDSHNVSG